MPEESYSNSKNWLTPKNIVLYLVIAGVVYGLVYYLFLAKKGTSPYTAPSSSQVQTSTPVAEPVVVLLGSQNNSGEGGQATLTEWAGGKITVLLEMENAPQGASQPAHIHLGSCPTPGEVKYPLSNVVNGKSETVIDADLATIKAQMPLAVNVHKSAAEISVYVACGDLK